MGLNKRLCLVLAYIVIFECFAVLPVEAKNRAYVDEAEVRATGKFDFEIAANTLMKASTSFPMEYGETVTITAVYSPQSASMDFGLIDADGIFYSFRAAGGSFDKIIKIDKRGHYSLAIRNNSSYNVSVSGFVNY